jgi:malate permease and related proteins
MNEVNIVVNQVIEFVILMAAGYIAAKCKVLTKSILEGIMKLIVKVLLPCLIFNVLVGGGATGADYLNNLGFGLAILVCYMVLFAVGSASGKLFRLKGCTYNVFVAESTFGDMGFIGIPLLLAVFKGTQTSMAISVYTVIDMALLWTLGVYLTSRHNKGAEGKPPVWKNMISPTSITLAIGLILVFCGIQVPTVVMDPIKSIGNASTPIALIFIGGMLSFVSFKQLFKKVSIFGIVGVKMILVPLLVFVVSSFFFNAQQSTTLMYMVGLPAMTTVSMLAQLYGSDQEYATSTVFITTLCCIGTLPLITWISVMLR